MLGTGQLLGLAGRVLAALLALSSCAGVGDRTPGAPAPAVPVAEFSATQGGVPGGPAVVDTQGAPLEEEHAEVVRSVHRVLVAGDLDALSALYAGDDWAGQAALLASPAVRRSVLDVLRAHPANLSEGYLYPAIGYPGYQTAFFLDYDPPSTGDGPLRWRGIALLPAESSPT